MFFGRRAKRRCFDNGAYTRGQVGNKSGGYRNSLQAIRSTHRLSLFEEGNRPQIEQYIKADMCKEIMRCMVENGAINFKLIEEDGDTTILATVMVLVPKNE